jgi:hypothetical protein
VFLTAIAAAVFHQEDSHADHRIQVLGVVHFPGLVDLVGASSVAEIVQQDMVANRRSWTGSCMPHRRNPGRSAGNYGYSCHRRCILRGSHLANMLLAMP